MRIRPYALVLGAIAVAAAAVETAPRAPQNPREKQLLVTVIADANGPQQNLSAADFVVVEDKGTREVTGSRLVTEPLSIVLLVDTSQPPMGSAAATLAQDLRRSLMSFVKTIQTASPDAQISYGEFAGAAVTRVPFTTKTDELEKVLTRVYPDQRGGAVLIEALIDAGAKLAQMPPPRRAIVSVDFNSPESSAEKSQKQAADNVQKSGATVWCVTIGSAGTNNTREVILNGLAKNTGGLRQTIVDVSALEGRLKSIANSLLSQYELTYVRPQNVTTVKDIQIETKKGGKALRTAWMR